MTGDCTTCRHRVTQGCYGCWIGSFNKYEPIKEKEMKQPCQRYGCMANKGRGRGGCISDVYTYTNCKKKESKMKDKSVNETDRAIKAVKESIEVWRGKKGRIEIRDKRLYLDCSISARPCCNEYGTAVTTICHCNGCPLDCSAGSVYEGVGKAKENGNLPALYQAIDNQIEYMEGVLKELEESKKPKELPFPKLMDNGDGDILFWYNEDEYMIVESCTYMIGSGYKGRPINSRPYNGTITLSNAILHPDKVSK